MPATRQNGKSAGGKKLTARTVDLCALSMALRRLCRFARAVGTRSRTFLFLFKVIFAVENMWWEVFMRGEDFAGGEFSKVEFKFDDGKF